MNLKQSRVTTKKKTVIRAVRNRRSFKIRPFVYKVHTDCGEFKHEPYLQFFPLSESPLLRKPFKQNKRKKKEET